jgi:hypothetical protein
MVHGRHGHLPTNGLRPVTHRTTGNEQYRYLTEARARRRCSNTFPIGRRRYFDLGTGDGPLLGVVLATNLRVQRRGTRLLARHAGHGPETEDRSNILLGVETQLRWLREVGFQEVDFQGKWRELALTGGIRGAPDAPT